MKAKEEILYMGHPGHFIGGMDCCFHLNTYVNGHIVSTVGQYLPRSRPVRDDERLKFETLGAGPDSFFETMVFSAKKNTDTEAACCPYVASNWSELEMERYSNGSDAHLGHHAMVRKYEQMVQAPDITQEYTEEKHP